MNGMYLLVMTNIAIENRDLEWIYPLKMVILHSYVKLPEGSRWLMMDNGNPWLINPWWFIDMGYLAF